MAQQGAGHEAEQIKEVIWQYAGWTVVLGACVGAGIFIGYQLWGDANSLRRDLEASVADVNRLKNERVTFESQIARLTSVRDGLEEQLTECRDVAKNPAAGGETP